MTRYNEASLRCNITDIPLPKKFRNYSCKYVTPNSIPEGYTECDKCGKNLSKCNFFWSLNYDSWDDEYNFCCIEKPSDALAMAAIIDSLKKL